MKKIIFSIAFFFLALPHLVLAQSLYDWQIDSFHADITVQPDGLLDITETIEANFDVYKHGIYRDIPVRYETEFGNNMSVGYKVISITDDAGNPWMYQTSRTGRNLEIKIGDPDVTITGPQTYVIHYTIDRALLYFDDHDELYWNATGTEWEVPIDNSSATVRREGVKAQDFMAKCFTGYYGSTAQDCDYEISNNQVEFSAEDFLTVVVGWPPGLVAKPSLAAKIGWFIRDNWVVGIPFIVFFALLYYWWHHGRDAKGRVTIVPEYEPPKGMTPGEMGTLIDTKVHPMDITATLIDLAVRGYLKIIETEKKKFLGSKMEYTLKKLKEPDAALKEHEKDMLEGIFGSGTTVELGAIKTKFYKTRAKMEKFLYGQMVADGYFTKNPKVIKGTFIAIGVAMLFLSQFAIFMGAAGVAAVVVSGILFIVFSFFMSKKTEKGTLAYEHALGFKLFLETAEKYRIQWQEKENIFEKYLPYAIVFGVADKWAAVFKDMVKDAPDWYEGDYPHGFTTGYLLGSLNDFSRGMNAVAATPAPSQGASGGHSGFGGGGFSGGGFGGGGGGSW